MLPAMTSDGSADFAHPHRRYNPLLDEWVLVSPHRLARPWQGQVEPAHPDGLPAYDPECYLCPGNRRANGSSNPAYASTFAFDNDFPALLPPPAVAAPSGAPSPDEDDLIIAQPQSGLCRVLCFSPRHDLTLARMDASAILGVVDGWADEVERLARMDGIRYIQVFENKGAAMGCSNPHPHGQIWASATVPYLPARKLAMQHRYAERHGRDLLGDYLEREVLDGARLVCRNDAWVVLVAFWAVWPFETLVIPTRKVDDLRSLSRDERTQLADILRRLNTRYDNLFGCSFPYSMGWHGRPIDGQAHLGCRLHAVYCPPLLRSATIRKFLVGYELTAEPQRDLTAEAAAERLRAQSEMHYLASGVTRGPE
jgi:UDPglucose--hexose-1-phosphate uridylyltransferase